MNVYLKHLLLACSIYPILVMVTACAVSLLIDHLLELLVYGLLVNALSLLGLIPVLGPLIYFSSLDLCRSITTVRSEHLIAIDAMGLVASMSYTVIATRALIDVVRR